MLDTLPLTHALDYANYQHSRLVHIRDLGVGYSQGIRTIYSNHQRQLC